MFIQSSYLSRKYTHDFLSVNGVSLLEDFAHFESNSVLMAWFPKKGNSGKSNICMHEVCYMLCTCSSIRHLK